MTEQYHPIRCTGARGTAPCLNIAVTILTVTPRTTEGPNRSYPLCISCAEKLAERWQRQNPRRQVAFNNFADPTMYAEGEGQHLPDPWHMPSWELTRFYDNLPTAVQEAIGGSWP